MPRGMVMWQGASVCPCERKCVLIGAIKRYNKSKGDSMSALRLFGSKMLIETRQHVQAGCSDRRLCSCHAVVTKDMPSDDQMKTNQVVREGDFETPLVVLQASKLDEEQEKIVSVLKRADPNGVADVVVVGCGPAGLSLAAELGAQGLTVSLIGHDVPFVNNYGVWKDEFDELKLEHTLDKIWDNASCYFREGEETKVGRAYGRVNRQNLRHELLMKCKDAGVEFYEGSVVSVEVAERNSDELEKNTWAESKVVLQDGTTFAGKLVTLASGVAAGRFLEYESSAPSTAAQTAYGIEAEVAGYDGAFNAETMLFMDFRRHHTGLYPGSAVKQVDGEHPNGGRGLWGTEKEVPSFLYAMPDSKTRVFLEETCLVSKPALPFSVLKRRLYRRCEALGIEIKKVYEEEWSYIPTGGPLPVASQGLTAFGAAANLVHPATGYSITRTLREAPGMALAIKKSLNEHSNAFDASKDVWDALWSMEKRRQASFHIFGMELLCELDLLNTCDFFAAFFSLPRKQWEGFLSTNLSSLELITFALLTFAIAPANIKYRLVNHLITHPAGKYLLETYTKSLQEQA